MVWLADRGQTLDRESVRVGLPSSLTHRLGIRAVVTVQSKRRSRNTRSVSSVAAATSSRLPVLAVRRYGTCVMLQRDRARTDCSWAE